MRRTWTGWAAGLGLAVWAAAAAGEPAAPLRIGLNIPSADHGWTGGVVWWAKRAIDDWPKKEPGLTFFLVTAASPADQVGQVELARRSLHTLKLYVKRARMGPLDTDKPIPEHAPTGVRPLELAYWRERRRQDPALGHCFKYPYGFYGLMGAARDADLKRRCLDMAFRVF